MGLEKFGVRALVSVVFGPLILFSAWVGGLFFFAVVALISGVALHEFFTMCEQKQVSPQKWLGLALGIGICWLIYYQSWQLLWQILVAGLVISVILELFRNKENAVLNISVTHAGLLYVSLPLGLLIAIRELRGLREAAETGAGIVILVFLSIWICDSAAYILGSRIGKHKLFPRVSPNKTVEGTAAGFLFAILTAWLVQLTFLKELPLFQVLIIGAICGSFGQASDLVESLFKRDAGVKDSSNLIPGHGGALDRFDSELVAVPVVYFYLVYCVV